jgi:hypothetical protein
LNYSSVSNSLVYLYYYRNEFICADTNLNLKYRGKTIDTNTVAKIKIAKLNSRNQLTLAEPPLLVNKSACVWKNYLFVQSHLIADNENKEIFRHASVMDVYNLQTGLYRFSFYLGDYGQNKVKSFKVADNHLVAIFGRYYLSYQLSPKYFSN